MLVKDGLFRGLETVVPKDNMDQHRDHLTLAQSGTPGHSRTARLTLRRCCNVIRRLNALGALFAVEKSKTTRRDARLPTLSHTNSS
jgi:hypothetical protein